MPEQSELLQILKTHWGYTSFRLGQGEIISHVVAGQDALALLPTGGGKSVIYQVAGLARGGLTIVVTPLIALMEDQVANLKRRGIRALFVHSGLGTHEVQRRLDAAMHGGFAFLYLSPERLLTRNFLLRLEEMDVRLLAIDEAHCISQWGQDFRPAYRRIGDLRERLEGVPVLAVTATATPRVAEDIRGQLAMPNARIFSSTFRRPGLSYRAGSFPDNVGMVYSILSRGLGPAIVYALYRNEVEQLASILVGRGIRAAAYHGGMLADDRAMVQEAFMQGEIEVIVATNAFGMGIDKEDVRVVLNLGLPENLEAYYQEAGRGGRDGEGAVAYLLHRDEDAPRLEANWRSKYPERTAVDRLVKQLFGTLGLQPGDDTLGPLDFDLEAFCQERGWWQGDALSILRLLEREGILHYDAEPVRGLRIQLTAGTEIMRSVGGEDERLDRLFRYLLSRYPDIRSFPAEVSGRGLQLAVRVTEYGLERLLESCASRGWLEVEYLEPVGCVEFFTPVCPNLPLELDWEGLALRRKADYKRMQYMVAYARNDAICRERVLREYFGEEVGEDCGICGVCLARARG